jgi:hypothetical protein
MMRYRLPDNVHAPEFVGEDSGVLEQKAMFQIDAMFFSG